MKRIHLLAAEIFNYSYANYEDHLGVNERYDKLMPDDAKILETAIKSKWPASKVAKRLGVTSEIATQLISATLEALAIVDAENPAESFKKSVEQSIHSALEKGLDCEEAITDLVTQISYRAADLGWLLKKEGHHLSQYSRYLRKEPGIDYYEGYFDEPFLDSRES